MPIERATGDELGDDALTRNAGLPVVDDRAAGTAVEDGGLAGADVEGGNDAGLLDRRPQRIPQVEPILETGGHRRRQEHRLEPEVDRPAQLLDRVADLDGGDDRR